MTAPADRPLVTFYSYKGGVGRTMALANVACVLANRQGHDVIAVDWDLEAPGLHYYFGLSDQDLTGQPGLLDYLEDFVAEVAKGADGVIPDLDRYLMIPPEPVTSRIKYGSLRLMACGDMGRDYMRRIQNFDWDRFYTDSQGYQIIETLKLALRDRAAVTLIDARAGQADIGTVSTIQVPDAVAMLFTSNRQNLHGTADIARQLKNHPTRRRNGQPDPHLLLVPSRVFSREDRFDRWLETEALPLYRELLAEGVVDGGDQPRGLAACVLPVDSRYTFEEALPALTHKGASDLVDGYDALAETIGDLCAGRSLWFAQRLLDTGEGAKAIDEWRRELAAAGERGDERGAAIVNHVLGTNLVVYGRGLEAEGHLTAALAYFSRLDDHARMADLRIATGQVRQQQGLWDEALAEFARARTLAIEAGADKIAADAWSAIAVIQAARGESNEALRIHREEVLPIWERLGDIRSRAVTLGKVADILSTRNEWDEALRIRREEELPVYERLGDVRARAATLGKVADILSDQGKREMALRILRDETLPAFEQMGDARSKAVALGRVADILAAQGDLVGALKIRRDEELPVYDQLGDVRSQAVTQVKVAKILAAQGENDQALRLYRDEALPVFERLGASREKNIVLELIASLRASATAPPT